MIGQQEVILWHVQNRNAYNSESKKQQCFFHITMLASEAYIFTMEMFINTGLCLYERGGFKASSKLFGVQMAPPEQIP